MITREQIYGKEATEILRYVTTYHCITRNHLLRIYPDKEKQIDNLLKYLLRQGRIFTSPNTADIFFDNSECCCNPITAMDREMLAALWVYADFSDRAEYHYAGEFPVKILFFADATAFDIIYVPEDKEALINCAAMQLDEDSKRIVIVETMEQIDKLTIPNTAAYCLVNLHTGEIQYYTTEETEEN